MERGAEQNIREICVFVFRGAPSIHITRVSLIVACASPGTCTSRETQTSNIPVPKHNTPSPFMVL